MQTFKKFNKSLIALQDNMFNLALKFTADMDEARDLVQDTNLRTLTNRDKFIDNRNFKGWVLTIMRNIFMNDYRRKVLIRSMIEQTDNIYNLSTVLNSGLDTPEGAIDYAEIKIKFNDLDEGYRKPFCMYLDGYKYIEIAKNTGVPLGTVKSRIFFARKKLKSTLVEYRQ